MNRPMFRCYWQPLCTIPIAVRLAVEMLTVMALESIPLLCTSRLTYPASEVVLYTVGLNSTRTIWAENMRSPYKTAGHLQDNTLHSP